MNCPHCEKRIRNITDRLLFSEPLMHEHIAQPCGHRVSCDIHKVLSNQQARRSGLIGKGESLGTMRMCHTTGLITSV